MNGFFDRMAQRAVGSEVRWTVRPRARFEPPTGQVGPVPTAGVAGLGDASSRRGPAGVGDRTATVEPGPAGRAARRGTDEETGMPDRLRDPGSVGDVARAAEGPGHEQVVGSGDGPRSRRGTERGGRPPPAPGGPAAPGTARSHEADARIGWAGSSAEQRVVVPGDATARIERPDGAARGPARAPSRRSVASAGLDRLDARAPRTPTVDDAALDDADLRDAALRDTVLVDTVLVDTALHDAFHAPAALAAAALDAATLDDTARGPAALDPAALDPAALDTATYAAPDDDALVRGHLLPALRARGVELGDEVDVRLAGEPRTPPGPGGTSVMVGVLRPGGGATDRGRPAPGAARRPAAPPQVHVHIDRVEVVRGAGPAPRPAPPPAAPAVPAAPHRDAAAENRLGDFLEQRRADRR